MAKVEDVNFLANLLQQQGAPEYIPPGQALPMQAPMVNPLRMRKGAPQQVQMDPRQAATTVMNTITPAEKSSVGADKFNELMQRYTEGLKAQREGASAMDAEYARMKGDKQNPWVTALMGVNDMVNNTQYLQNYQQQQAQKQRDLADYGVKIQGSKNAITDKEIELFKAQWQNDQDAAKLKQERELAYGKMATDKAIAGSKPVEIKDSQALSAGYGKRMLQAEEVFSDLTKKGYNRANVEQGLRSYLPGATKDENLKRQEQAEANFINASLRRESGAAISPDEYKKAEQQYFERAGDTQQVKDQKRANRAQQVESLRVAGGPAWDQVALISPNKEKKSRPASIVQDGHTYTLNPNTGEYE